MTAPLSQDLRERIVRVVEGGSSGGGRHDPESGPPLCRERLGGHQADAAGAPDRQRSASEDWGLPASPAGEARGRPAGHRVEQGWDHTAGARYTTLLRAVELWGAVQADGPGRLAGDEEPPAVDGFVVGREENFSQ